MKTLEDIYGPFITKELVESLLTASIKGREASTKATEHFVYADTLDRRAINANKATEFWMALNNMCSEWLDANPSNVVHLDLKYRDRSQMIMLVNKILYVVSNASCYNAAVEAIAVKEGISPHEADNLIYTHNCKKGKVEFLQSEGYKKLSSLNMTQLDSLLLKHFNMEVQ